MALSFFALLDDIASMMDDLSVLTKVATKKTAGVLGDDLALNAYQMVGLSAKRELPVVWAVTKGSIVNKVILVPVAIVLSYWLPWLIHYLLMCGGAYLCYEGIENVWHYLSRQGKNHSESPSLSQQTPEQEQEKIRQAVRTDFVLSAEIVIIALGELLKYSASVTMQATVLSLVALLVTFCVYGIVAILVKLDDIGRYWQQTKQGFLSMIGVFLLWFAPRMLKMLSIVGTIAMFVVGGHIWVDGIPQLHHFLVEHIPTALTSFESIITIGLDILTGTMVGIVMISVIKIIRLCISTVTSHG